MEKSGFFNSSGGDRVYNATDFAGYFSKLVSNGIFTTIATNLQVIATSGMIVNVLTGSAWINGYSYENTSSLELTITTANGVNPRIDRVVIRWSATDRNIRIVIKTGVATAIPIAPTLTRTDDIYELGIADIAVARGVVVITADNITDTRLCSSLCGTVNSLISAVYE